MHNLNMQISSYTGHKYTEYIESILVAFTLLFANMT